MAPGKASKQGVPGPAVPSSVQISCWKLKYEFSLPVMTQEGKGWKTWWGKASGVQTKIQNKTRKTRCNETSVAKLLNVESVDV